MQNTAWHPGIITIDARWTMNVLPHIIGRYRRSHKISVLIDSHRVSAGAAPERSVAKDGIHIGKNGDENSKAGRQSRQIGDEVDRKNRMIRTFTAD